MPFIKLPLDFKADVKSHIADLHNALTKLNVLPKSDKSTQIPKVLDITLTDAIKVFKTNNSLGTGATINAKTIEGINVALHDNFIVTNKSRVNNIHQMLEKIDLSIDKNEVNKRSVGDSTRKAIEDFQKANNLPQDGKISETLFVKLDEAFIEKKFSAKIQINTLQKDLLTIRRIAKMEDRIDETELKNKEIGRTTTAFIEKFQTKYNLKPTGKLDRSTLDKINSVVASRGIVTATLKKVNAQEVKTVSKSLRLNMVRPEVSKAQQALAYLGFNIDDKEHKNNTFGKTTQVAVLAFQKSRGLEQSGHLVGKTLRILNSTILELNPTADTGLKYRIRGSVRDELWNRTPNMVLKIYEKLVDGKSAEPLMTKKNMLNGFFDITYNPPKDPNNGQIKKEINLIVELYNSVNSNPANDVFITSKIFNNVARIQWVNFTLGDDKYQGDSDFTVLMSLIDKIIGKNNLVNISEKPENKQVSQLSKQTGLSTDDIIRLFISHKIAINIAKPVLSPEIFYAFLRQNLPSELPSDLFFPVSTSWDVSDTLIENAESGIGFLNTETHTSVIETAIAENLVSRLVFKQKDEILKALADLQIQFSLSKPILVGNGNIQSLINISTIQAQHASAIAQAFIQNSGFNEPFWKVLEANPNINNLQVADLKATVDLGGITKNFEPILIAFKTDIKNGKFNAVSDIAKLSHQELEDYIRENNNQVPANLKGTVDENITAYASTLRVRSENQFPSIAFTATIKRSNANPFQQIDKVVTFFDANLNFKIKEQTVDTYLTQNAIVLDKPTLSTLKSVVRVQKIARDAEVGVKLVENNLHSSMQVYFAGKENLIAKGLDPKVAVKVFENAKMQYSQVLGKMFHLKPEINLGTPAAISKQTYTKEEIKQLLGDIPDLETLFGNLDFCECEYCRSLYGPSAYLTDMLRFLKTHQSLTLGRNVKDILFDRRPDLGTIKLNCENTNTPIPYIDLVCEILENNISPLAPIANFDFQTTLTKKELRALPQNLRTEAYDTLAISDFPMNSSFNLGQEEARTNLNFLGIPRFELMEKFQDVSINNNKIPTDSLIAAEYFGISINEKDIISTKRITKVVQEKYWGFDAVKDAIWQDVLTPNVSVSVQNFMKRCQLSYNEVLELLLVKFINPLVNQSEINRPSDSCSTDVQFINNLTFDKLDLMHRFIRLWRSAAQQKTGWKLWELDLMLRNPKVGGNKIDEDTLSNLKTFRQLQEKLFLPVESLLTFFADINTEQRINPEKLTVKIPSLYEALFQNPTISRQIDVKFTLPLNNALILGINAAEANYTPVPTILSALSIRQEDFDKIVGKTDGHLSLSSISMLFRYSYLAKTMKLSIVDMLLLMQINTADPFISPQTVADFLKNYDVIKNSSLSINELDYVLNFNPTSSIGWREEVYIQILDNLKSVISLKNQDTLQIQSLISNAFGLPENQIAILLKLKFPPTNTKSLLEILSDEVILQINPDLSNHKTVLLLLHKVSLLIHKMNIDEKNLIWFIDNFNTVKTLNFAELPTKALMGNQYNAWVNLHKFFDFKNKYPEPENASLCGVLNKVIYNASTKDDIFSEINKITQWDTSMSLNLKDLDNNLKLTKANYLEADTFERLQKCFEVLKISGVDANTIFSWNDLGNISVASQTRLAIKSKFENDDWLAKITPLQDDLREKKRKALVAYFIEFALRNEPKTVIVNGKSIPNPKYFEDSNSLFKYYLIDVEMSACQLTSRIKQAISSTQFFVQRCFLNLENRFVQVSQDEKEETSSPNAWSQWKWMKYYRIWEANRKVFLYPENWIMPELRDDKSKFFEELESEILQNEITHDNVENAFLSYLHKLDDVAHLDVCGTYHEQEDMNPSETGFERDIMHVIGRTKAVPHIYYYRKYDLNYSTWTAWEKIDLDITGDHLVPVVYNRKLHIFWLIAIEKPVKLKRIPAAKPTAGASPTQETQEPTKFWEIQLAWSILKHSGWSPKKVSKDKLIHPWERPLFSYHLKPFYFSKLNQLYLDVYISTSEKFNSGDFYNQFTGQRNRLTKYPFNEGFLPWHSSSFIFDGDIQAIKFKSRGSYADFSFWGKSKIGGDSLQLVQNVFDESNEKIIKSLELIEQGPRLKLPKGMHFFNNRLTNNRAQINNSNQLNILNNGGDTNLLRNAQNPFEIVATQQDKQYDSSIHPLFYQDSQRAFFIRPESVPHLDDYNQQDGTIRNYRFRPFYHPFTNLFLRELNRSGLDGLLNRKIQVNPQSFPPVNSFNFAGYLPTTNAIVDETAKIDTVDFSLGGAYSIYNWELFFHAPLMIATQLSQNQRFEESMRWFHYIFDPTNIGTNPDDSTIVPTPQRYWITKPFFKYNADNYREQRIEDILKNIGKKENNDQLIAWKNNPFNPHIIARYRPVAYQKSVVMKYIDNLIAWGDMLFRRDTIESINEASMLYMLAYEILGERPIKVPNVTHEDKNFNEIEAKLDDFGNSRVDIILEDTALPIKIFASGSGNEPMPKIDTFYFCIPNNDLILKYWDTVEDRLFKIRHCMNIEGLVRQLPLFEPPIDPALLVKAAAAGIDLNSVLNDIASGTPFYRFRTTVQKAIEFCNEVKMLGEKLLGVIEKKDAEQLTLLRSEHEIQMQKAVKEVRKRQIDDAVETIGGLNKAFEMATQKESYYSDIARMNTWEDLGAVAHGLGIISEIVTTVLNTTAAVVELVPATFTFGVAGFGGSPVFTNTYGSQNIAKSSLNFAALFQGLSSILHSGGSMLETQGSYSRRDDENKQQAKIAKIERDQVQFQINAAEIRQAIAEKELENQELHIEHSISEDEYMRSKYSNVQLYSWMLSQVSSLYFQAYQLAYDMAKKAEKCYQHELGDVSTNFVQPVYWDSLKKGLLSGDKLMHDLRRMEGAYIDNNKRELEIRKHISLATMFPLQLIQLKETGKCTLKLPEWLFNMDYPGHFFRRIKNVTISIPCIVGPYTSINCTLSLIKSTIRVDSTGANYPATDENDVRFRTQLGAITSIATSHAQNDSGMFELNFNDERYLPFEGSGVVSEWLIELPKEHNYFDFQSLSDAILHFSYTARNGGEVLGLKAKVDLDTNLPNNITRLFSLKHEFPNEWFRFMNPIIGVLPEMVFNVKTENYPFFARTKINIIQLKSADVWVESTENINADIKITNGALQNNVAINKDVSFNNVPHIHTNIGSVSSTGEIRIKINTQNVLSKIDNIYLLVQSS